MFLALLFCALQIVMGFMAIGLWEAELGGKPSYLLGFMVVVPTLGAYISMILGFATAIALLCP